MPQTAAPLIESTHVNLDALKVNAKNYNRHSKPGVIERMADRMRLAAFTAPVVVDEDNVLLGGHLRRLALLWLRDNDYSEPPGVLEGWQVPARCRLAGIQMTGWKACWRSWQFQTSNRISKRTKANSTGKRLLPARNAAMSSHPELKLDWCTHAAAKYACEKWHYSKRIPIGPMLRIGVWEPDYVGCVLFARGANPSISKAYNLEQTEACELVRIAISSHKAPITRIVAVAVKMLRAKCPGLRLIVSYADSAQGHHGGIYQAGNWTYVGKTSDAVEWFHEGRWKHNREMTSGAFGKARKVKDYKKLPSRATPGKHKYLMPLDKEMKAKVALLAKPYPKRASERADGGTPAPAGRGGSIPTQTLLVPRP